MEKFKVVIPNPNYFPDESLTRLKQVANVVSKKLSREELINEIKDAHAVMIRVDTILDKEVIDAARSLKIIGSATTGIDHIDSAYAAEKGIKIFNLTGTHTVPTAEYTFALILSASRKIPFAHASTKLGAWDRHKFMGNTLEGKTLGVVGFGRIGRRVGEYAKAFGMKIVAFDPYTPSDIFSQAGVTQVSFEELLKVSDVVTLHAVLTKETENLFGDKTFSQMKDGTILVNASRGEIVDDPALIRALESGKISAAAVDVFRTEPVTADNKLVDYAKSHENLILTPHIAASTHEAVKEASQFIAQRVFESLTEQSSTNA